MEENKPEGIAEIPDARLAPENITEEIAAMRDAVLAAELRASACVRAMSGIEDPAAFMAEVREVLGNLTALAAPHFSDDTQMLALAQARALLEKMVQANG